jgi:G3E family GTPase
MNRSNKRPVVVITGFLGSGKTTLLSRALADPLLKNSVVLVNEYGKVGLDHHLFRQMEEQTVLIGGGCMCCTVREDLVKSLRELLDADHRGSISPLDRVIVETSGLADPAPILFTILTDPVLQHHFYIDRVIVTVDAINGHLHLDRHPESMKQVTVADTILITKTDIASSEEVDQLITRLHAINPTAQIIQSVYGNVDIESLFIIGTQHQTASYSKMKLEDVNQGGDHVPNTRSISLTFDEPIDWTAFSLWLSMLLYAHGQDVMRVKGLLDVGEAGPVMLNGVQHIMHPPEHLHEWSNDDRKSHVVFIMRSIDPQEILTSLQAFANIMGARASLMEIMDVSA